MVYKLERCGFGCARRITLDSVCVAMVLQHTSGSWGLYSTSEKKLSNVTFKTPNEAKVFFVSHLKDIV